NAAGCDSIATLNLAINAVSSTTTNISICPNQLPYNWNGNIINNAGAYADTLIGASGCDSVSHLVLTVKANSTSTTNIAVCPAQLPYSWNGNSYNAAGSYNITLVNAAGCDSVATLNLTVKANSTSTTNVAVCPAQLPYSWNSNSYNAAGSYNVTLVNAAGCDSVTTLNLTVKANSTSTTNIAVCPAQLPYTWNSNSYNAAGTYFVTLSNAAGCDSVAQLILSVHQNTGSSSIVKICANQVPYNWNGNSYSMSGTYTHQLTNIAGCDSIAILQLTIAQPSQSTTTIQICQEQFPFRWNQQNFTNAGTFIVHLINAAGCDSAATLQLNLNPSPIAFSLGNDTSICPGDTIHLYPGNFTHYLWQDFSTANNYTVTQSGNYSVIVSNQFGCKAAASIKVQYLDNCGDIYFANAFSPNGDGKNDQFGALGNLFLVSNYSLYIYNRYGELVFSTHNPYQRWDGRYKLKEYGNTNFVWYSKYVLNGKTQRSQKGNLVLVR
ncbi:MAG: hypothetical protein RLY16_1511, partial [Bacteroidota bacterium]